MGGDMSTAMRRRLKTLLRRKEERDLAGLPSQATTLPGHHSSVDQGGQRVSFDQHVSFEEDHTAQGHPGGALSSPQPSVVSGQDMDEVSLTRGKLGNGYSDGTV